MDICLKKHPERLVCHSCYVLVMRLEDKTVYALL